MTQRSMFSVLIALFLAGCGVRNAQVSDVDHDGEQLSDLDSDVLAVTSGAKRIIFDHTDSGRVFDGKGKEFNNGKRTMIVFQSVQENGKWLYPTDIVFKNWKINGALRVLGVGPSSDTTLVKESSGKLGHTQRMRDAAPRNITLQNLVISTDEKIPLVFGPGVHAVTFENSAVVGKSRSVAMYLDAESGDNIIRNNIFNIEASREVIAVDGSARNIISGNIFNSMSKGAVHVYRNSGERGVVRHQEPLHNKIRGNYFNVVDMKSGRAVFLGSRNGTNPNYRHDDRQFDFGSGAINRDFARENVVSGNKAGGSDVDFKKFFLKDTEGENQVKGNSAVTQLEGVAKILRKFENTLEMPALKELIEALR